MQVSSSPFLLDQLFCHSYIYKLSWIHSLLNKIQAGTVVHINKKDQAFVKVWNETKWSETWTGGHVVSLPLYQSDILILWDSFLFHFGGKQMANISSFLQGASKVE